MDEVGALQDSHAPRGPPACLNGQPVMAAQVKRTRRHSGIAAGGVVRAAAPRAVKAAGTRNTVQRVRDSYASSMDRGMGARPWR